MQQFFFEFKSFFKKGDMVLLLLCLITSAFGCVVLASATSAPKFNGNARYLIIQLAAVAMGVFMYAIMSSIDVETMSEYRNLLVAFNFVVADDLPLLSSAISWDYNWGNDQNPATEAGWTSPACPL